MPKIKMFPILVKDQHIGRIVASGTRKIDKHLNYNKNVDTVFLQCSLI